MRNYVVSCEFRRSKRASAFNRHLQSVAQEWHHPHAGLWLIKTPLSAHELRKELMSHLRDRDRLFICETGAEKAAFNSLPTSGQHPMQLSQPRKQSRLLTSIFSRTPTPPPSFRGASAGSWLSA